MRSPQCFGAAAPFMSRARTLTQPAAYIKLGVSPRRASFACGRGETSGERAW